MFTFTCKYVKTKYIKETLETLKILMIFYDYFALYLTHLFSSYNRLEHVKSAIRPTSFCSQNYWQNSQDSPEILIFRR